MIIMNPAIPAEALSLNQVWLAVLSALTWNGDTISPRGQNTFELPSMTVVVDMRHPVLTVPARNLSYRFMAAEAYWIISGDDKVETIAPYNQRIRDFSDDGDRFFGAYGPKIAAQLPYVVQKLMDDPSSRQAGLTIWRENPPPTKDVPCTVAIFFHVRSDAVNAHVYMRSSDAWLGLPYDVFNFSMLAHYVTALLNQRLRGQYQQTEASHYDAAGATQYRVGQLFLTAASGHLYERDFEPARACLQGWDGNETWQSAERLAITSLATPPVPLILSRDPAAMLGWLERIRDDGVNGEYRWWRS